MSTETKTGPCADCGEPAAFEFDGPLGATGQRFLDAMTLRCDPCDAKQSAQWEAEEANRQRVSERNAHMQRIKWSGIPALLLDVDLSALDALGCADAINAARFWAAKGGGLLLTGPFGTGKTTVAAGALRLVLERRSGRWTSAPLMMARLGSGLDSRERAETMAMLTGSAALVIDDMDKTRPTEYGAEQIFLAVDGAVTSGRSLLVTSNLSLAQLAQKWPQPFGEAIASRLAGYCEVVQVTGRDRRLDGAA